MKRSLHLFTLTGLMFAALTCYLVSSIAGMAFFLFVGAALELTFWYRLFAGNREIPEPK